MTRLESAAALEARRKSILEGQDPQRQTIFVCGGTGCLSNGSLGVARAFEEELKKQSIQAAVSVKMTGCAGYCERGPLVTFTPQRIFYQRVTEKAVPDLVKTTLIEGRAVEKFLYEDPATKQRIAHEEEIPFYQHQLRWVLENNGKIVPTDIDDYVARGGYAGVSKALTQMTPDQIIDQVDKAGLRGRGGGGFPTARKWRTTRQAPGATRYVICNGDEGDPGAFMDRSIMEADPHAVIEGMIIGGFAIGAPKGYIYVRMEYPLAVKNLSKAIGDARSLGLLGDNILGSGFSFDIEISRGGGAFVCGESSALVQSIMGRAGEPQAKYVHTSEKGLWEMPTNLNNVETWANVPLIITRGADWFSGVGTGTSKGTKVFSLVGNVKNVGLVEVPMGLTLRRIIFEIGGGIRGDKKFKAVQTGGPSGGCIPEQYLDTPVDFDELTKLGSMMGSGGMIVMDEGTCMVDVARYFINFLVDESCGKCTPCREGLRQFLTILTRITEGEGKDGDIELLTDIGEGMIWGSLCALGGSAPNPVMTTIKYFRDEYEAHIRDKRCPAGVCTKLITLSIDKESCIACGRCKKVCPVNCIAGEKKVAHVIDESICIRCRACYEVCPVDAVNIR
jgi:NADH-quinone oxidoreductase subunit F